MIFSFYLTFINLKSIKSKIKLALNIILLFFIPSQLFAKHIVGGELSYKYLGNNNYRITLNIYRDCSTNVPFDNPLYLTVFDSSGNVIFNPSISFPGSVNLPVNTGNICLTAPPNLCVDEATYVTTINLPPIPGGYTIVYQRCCRNNTIQNINNPGGTGASYVATIPDSVLAIGNSSPVFNTFPPIVICNNEPLSVDQSATDPDGDSLVYKLFNPFDGASQNAPEPSQANPPPFQPVNFIGGYSYTNPIGGTPPLSIDPKTGLLTGKPSNLGQFVVGVSVYEYRNGKLLGIHYRDFQFNVVTCLQNVHAQIFPKGSSDTLKICNGSVISFPNNSVNGTYYHWDFGVQGKSSDTSNLKLPTFNYPGQGIYRVILTVNPGFSCSSNDTGTLIVYPIPAPVISTNSSLCFGDSLKLFSTAVSLGNYSWTGPNGFTSSLQNPVIANSTLPDSGIYQLKVSANNCSSGILASKVIIYPIPIAPVISSNSPLCIGAILNLSAANVANGKFNWTGPNKFSSVNQNPSINPSVFADSGIYTVTVTVDNCTSPPASTTVIINPIPKPPVVSNNAPFCEGLNLNLLSNAVAGATYSWIGPDKFISAQQNPVITNTTAIADSGLYSLTVTVKGCTSNPSFTNAVIYRYPVITATSNSSVCIGSSLKLSVASIANAAYSWSGPNNFISSQQNPVIISSAFADSGIYTVTVTANGCGTTSNTRVKIYPIPMPPVISNDAPMCAGGTLDLTATNVAGGTFHWAGPNGFVSGIQNPVIPNVPFTDSGNYTATVTVNGCTSPPSNTSLALVRFSPPAIPVNNGPLCVGQNLKLTTTAFNSVTYVWTGPNGFTSSVQSPFINNVSLNDTGNYLLTVTIRACSGKTVATKVLIYPIPAAPVLSSNSPICAVQTLDLKAANVIMGKFNWSGPGSYTSSAQNPVLNKTTTSNSGSYTSTVTVNGCTSPASQITVVVKPAPPTPILSSNSPVCAGGTLQLKAGTIANATYSWIGVGSNEFISTLQNPVIANANVGNTGYYSVTDTVNGCSSLPSILKATVYPIPSSQFIIDTPLCSGYTTIATYNGSSLPTAIYNWNFGAAQADSSVGQGPHTISWANAGNYSVSLSVTDSGGCISPIATQALLVNAVPSPLFTMPSAICLSDSANIKYIGSGSANAIYNWNFGGGSVLSGNGQGAYWINYATAGNYLTTLSVKEFGCLSPTDTEKINVYPIQTADFTVSRSVICPDQETTVTYTGSGNATNNFQWNYNNGTGTTSGIGPHVIHFLNPGVNALSLVVTDNICPSIIFTQKLIVDSLPLVNFNVNGPGCNPFTANFVNETRLGFAYLWRFGDNQTDTATNPTHIYSLGSYNVTLISTTVSGCMDSLTQPNLVNVLNEPEANFNYAPLNIPLTNPIELKNAQFNFTNLSKYADNYTWFFGNGDSSNVVSPTYIYSDTGKFTVTLVAKNDIGCIDTFRLGVIDVIPNVEYAIPNVFTPNGDGKNDVFLVYGKSLASVHLTIYDRIGERLFESFNVGEGWDGTFKGNKMNTGVYVYEAEIQTQTNQQVKLHGDVTLLR